MRILHLFVAIAAVSGGAASAVTPERTGTPVPAAATCPSREQPSAVSWHTAEPADALELARWCRAVGRPIFVSAAPGATVPALDEFVTVSWNAHLAEGQLAHLIDDLRSGKLTGGRPVRHFALLVQELYRRGDGVPAFDDRDRSAFAIVPRDPGAADVEDYAAALGMSLLYVPSMRNGAELREDRGNAIISTEPLLDPTAIELPLARQRRVALGAGVMVRTSDGVRRLEIVNAHLEPLSSPRTLWIFKNPRGRQVRAILDWLDTPRFHDGTRLGVVLGGDFNTVKGGDREEGYQHARAWSNGLHREDRRKTHMMGRLDYLFFRLPPGWHGSTARVDERYGSDHHPVFGRISREPAPGTR